MFSQTGLELPEVLRDVFLEFGPFEDVVPVERPVHIWMWIGPEEYECLLYLLYQQ